MQQNTEAWLEWRGDALGSSDAPVLMGASPYATPYELWLEKTGRKEKEKEKFAFTMGHQAEPFIRAVAEERLGELFEPDCLRCSEFPFMQASVDGRNIDTTHLMEIKVNPMDVHQLLPSKPEAIPQMHFWQMQHQLIVTKADVCLYVSAPKMDNWEDLKQDDLHIVPVRLSDAAALDLIQAEGKFIELLATDTPPPLEERDGVHMKSAAWRRNAAQWLKLNNQIKALKQKQDRVAGRLKELSGGVAVARGYGAIVRNTVVKGNINYKKIPQLDGIDLDQYRSKGYIKSTVGEE